MLRFVSPALALAAVTSTFPPSGTSPESQARIVSADAASRAAGNRLSTALCIGLALFRTEWPAQVVRVRVDGVGPHEVAELTLSAVKFHGRVGLVLFDREVAEIVKRSFAAGRVEEIDVLAKAPIRVGEHAVVSGDLAVPTARVVFSVTVRRDDGGDLLRRLQQQRDVFVDPRFRSDLVAADTSLP